MSLLDELSDPRVWERFYDYKAGLACHKVFLKALREFIDRQGYVDVCAAIEEEQPFPLPKKAVISKMATGKKRTVYTYPDDENTVLKLLTWLLLRRYDYIFPKSLYSFRPGVTAKDAFLRLASVPGIGGKYAYKTDVSDYFNSAPVDALVEQLEGVFADDPKLFSFLKRLLEEPEVLDGNERITEQKGMMAGTPLSAFYANLFLSDLDRDFAEAGTPYARYSDDIIVFADTPEELESHAEKIRQYLAAAGLNVNPKKEEYYAPDTGFVFLGFSYRGGVIDVAPASVAKLKAKMRRKARALARWAKRKGLDGDKAARAFVKAFNRKLYEGGRDSELTWALWFFPVINTAESLGTLDRYAEDCIRFLAAGTRTKARFNVRYEDLKALGFRPLKHEYYRFRDGKTDRPGGENEVAPDGADEEMKTLR
ncbi:MAG: hypothetical protein IK104_07930 [Clostridia bacterium]|nr:hypothetical protein [Clostridia bacterium]